MKEQKTAILIFANSAEKEITSKPFSSRMLFESLNDQTLSTAKKTGLPYFHFSEKQQTGNCFGERFTNAIETVYNYGFDAIITIGNDTPHLTASHILKTAQKLQKHNIVLGPSTDGGFYLMGLKKPEFNKEAFLKLPWQKSTLNRSISRLVTSKKIAICYLEVLTDIDTASDINLVLNSFKALASKIKTLLIQLLLKVKKSCFLPFYTFENFILNQQFNKGSPKSLHL